MKVGALVETRILDNGDHLDVYPMMFGTRLTLTLAENPYKEETYDNCWCYEDVVTCVVQQQTWDGVGDPEGWKRHPDSGRRRPGGDASQEYVNP